MLTTYDPEMTMRQARSKYFEVNQFGDNGGYDDAWVDFKFGPVPLPFPNTKERVRAVRYHDLHHIVTGYDTDIRGECEIGAWEIGAGCKDFVEAWRLNLTSVTGGLFFAPKRTFRAFVRGRRSASLYGRPIDLLLDKTVADIRQETGVDGVSNSNYDWKDVALFGLTATSGVLPAIAFLMIALPVAPVAIAASVTKSVVTSSKISKVKALISRFAHLST